MSYKDLSQNDIGDRGACFIASVLKAGTQFTTICTQPVWVFLLVVLFLEMKKKAPILY